MIRAPNIANAWHCTAVRASLVLFVLNRITHISGFPVPSILHESFRQREVLNVMPFRSQFATFGRWIPGAEIMTKQNVLLTSYPHKTQRGDATSLNIQMLFCLIPRNTPPPPSHRLSPLSLSLSLALSLIPSLPAFQTGTMLIKVARSVNLRGEWD